MEGVVNVEWHGQDYLLIKWHVVCSGVITPGLGSTIGDGQTDRHRERERERERERDLF